ITPVRTRASLSKSYAASILVCILRTSPPMRRNSTRTKGSGRKPNGNWRIAAPKDIDELMDDIIGSINGIRRSPRKLRACIEQSELPSFCAKSLHYLYVDQIVRG